MAYCAKPGCPYPAAVALAYDYAQRRAVLEDPPDGRPPPHLYAICTGCAEKLTAPRGWVLEDRRRTPSLLPTEYASGGTR